MPSDPSSGLGRVTMPLKVGTWTDTLILFFFSSSILLLSSPIALLAVNPQGEALLSWKQSFNGSLQALSDWDARDPTPCRWFGVTCDGGGRIVELNIGYVDLFGRMPSNLSALAPSLARLVLTGANISGPIPPQLGADLPQLELLDLSNNELTGEIPDGLFRPGSRLGRLQLNSNRLEGQIPDTIGNLTGLKWLILYDNQLAGRIPPTIGKLGSLQVFRAGGNKNLQGPLPWEIGNCSSLELLGLAETSISGSLPGSLGQLKRLETLAIYTALISGAIPPELGQCSSLQNIYLYENSITGSIPTQLGNLKYLNNLLLWQNSIVGVIPPTLGYCSELAVIDLSMNGLTGPIPSSLGNLTSLQELQLSVNQISGQIPPELSNCGNLTDLQLDNNQISSSIPAELGKLSNLRLLYLWQNELIGNIPAEIGRCTNLEAVDLSQNSLTGAIPSEIFSLPKLAKLLLLNNDLSGEIPAGIGNCSSLIRFRANLNRIAGKIPAEIGSLKNLSFLDLGTNRISGHIPTEIAGCRNLTFIDLHSNQISGVLPDGLFEALILLQYLDLSNNSVSGGLPSDLGLLTSMTKLILGSNQFSGQIPYETGSCSRLQLLDLGKNLLSGAIPASLGTIPALEIGLNLSLNALTGPIPAEFAGLVRLGMLDLSHNKLSGDLRPLSTLQNLVALNISYNNFSGRVPNSSFFSKLPIADLEANPSLCLAQCSAATEKIGSKSLVGARVATAVLLTAAVLLLLLAALILVSKRKRGGKGLADEEKGGELSPPWEVTLYQKLDIAVADVARSLTAVNVIGNGWSGNVYRVRNPFTGSVIAVKRFRGLDEMGIVAFESEIGTLSRIRHRNIVRLLGWAANHKTRLLFYNYLPNGTLGGLLHSTGAPAVEWEVRLGIAIGVSEGLAYLHHDCVPGIIHRDVKADNVLLGERYEACLADFGLARVVDDDEGGLSTAPPFAGSYGYIAPEYGNMTRITKKSDVYSFGVLLLEIITGRKPVTDPSYPEGQSVVQWVRDHLREKRDPAEVVDPRLQGRPDAQVQEMLQALGIALLCSSNRPNDRPTMKDVTALLREIRHIDSPAASTKPGSIESLKLSSSPSRTTAKVDGSQQCLSLAYSTSASENFK